MAQTETATEPANAAELVGLAVKNLSIRKPKRGDSGVYLWAAVCELFGLGSTRAKLLCEMFGIDPDTKVSSTLSR
jgi:hypothetical protein